MSQLTEAITPEEGGQLFHQDKKDLFQQPLDVESILPNLGPEAQRYIEMVTSNSYQTLINRLKRIVNRPITDVRVPDLISLIMDGIQRITLLQRGHEEELEKMALDVIFELEEFKLFKELKDNGSIRFDVRLTQADLTNAITQQDLEVPQGGLSDVEQDALQLGNQLQDGDEAILKRKFANMITQGNAVNKLYLFNLASDKLNAINPALVNLYGILSSVVQISYYALPQMRISKNLASQSAVGSVEVVPDGEIYTIKARSPFFPYLIHEIVKGMYDYLSMDLIGQRGLDQETIDDELVDIIAGPDLYNRLTASIPHEYVKYTPLIYKLLLAKDPNTIKEVLMGGNRASRIMTELAHEAEHVFDVSEDIYKDSGEDEPEDHGF